MKTKMTILGLVVTNVLSAQVITTNSYSLNPNLGISDGNPVGLMEQFKVEGLSGQVTDIQVNLNITGGFNGDLYAYLVGPQGQLAVLLNRVGVTGSNPFGYSDAGMNITLDGLAVNNIHDYGNGSLNGTIWAADGRNVNPQVDGATLYEAPTTANLSLFQDTDANGQWTLFIADLSSGGGTTYLNNVMLTIMTVPEPQAWALLGGGLAAFGLCRKWCRRGR
jgi:subtilisin-like proprotein convertase family protein